MDLNKCNIEKLPQLYIPKDMRFTDKIFIHNNLLYKVFGDNSFTTEKNRNIDFLINNSVPNTPKIIEKLYKGNEFYGYIMEYIPRALTFRQAIKENIPIDCKIKAITDVYEAMKYLHSYNIYLGDIHSDNMLITSDKGYLIDLEEIRFPGDDFKFKQCYLVRANSLENRINIPSVYTDNVKLMICSLSLLLEKDLEKYVDPKRYDINLEKLYNEVIVPLNDEKLTIYFAYLMQERFTEYFPDYYFSHSKHKDRIIKKTML